MHILNRLVLIVACLLPVSSTVGQLKDTSLYTMYSAPFFFNVIKGEGDRIYAGTSEGIYTVKGTALVKQDDRIGYVKLDREGKLQIDANGIKYYRQEEFSKLLPYPDELRNEFHAGTDDFFYITAGGKMHIYEILPYAIKHRNISVRASSGRFTGTYSGLFYKGIKLGSPFPDFADGHIREINGKSFICFSTLLIADLPGGDSLPAYNNALPPGFRFDYISDILFDERRQQYFVATRNQLGIIDLELTRAQPVYTRNESVGEVELLGEDRHSIVFASGNKLIRYTQSNTIQQIATLPAQILDGHITKYNYFLLCSNALYVLRTDGKLEKLVELNKAHTLQQISATEYAIATDLGLFLYNTASNKLFELIRGVEFNRRGLYLEGDSLKAGSISGMYILDARHLESLAARRENVSGSSTFPAFMLYLLIGFVVIAIILAFLLIKSRKRLEQVIEEKRITETPAISRLDIEDYIRENLAVASLKSITDKFETKNANIYTLLAPEKPGAFINRLRMDEVMRMRKEKKSAREISALTGFSESYVRKVWNQNEQ